MRGEETFMFAMSRVGMQSALPRWLALVGALAFCQPLCATPVQPPDVSANEDDPPHTIDLLAVFPDLVAPNTYVVSSDNAAVDASVAGDTLTLTYQPDASATGVKVTIDATDSALTTESVAFAVDLAPVNDAPQTVTNPVTANANEDDPSVDIPVDGAFSDVDDASLTYSVEGVDNTTLAVGTAIVGNVLRVSLGPDQSGTVNITVRATDAGSLFADTTVRLDVAGANDAPVAVLPPPDGVFAEDSGAQSISLATAFTDIDGPSSTLTVINVSNGTLFSVPPSIAGTSLEFTLAADANGGSDVTVQNDDGAGGIATTFVAVTVTPVNDAPTVLAALSPVDIAEDVGAQNVSFAGVFDDVDGDPLDLTVTGVTNAALFSVAPAMVGTDLTFTPAPDANGSSTITVQADDGNGGTVTSDVTINVAVANDAPIVVGTIADITIDEDAAAVPVDLTGVFDDADIVPNGDSLELDAVPSNATLFDAATNLAGNTLTLVLAANQNGTSLVTVTATDDAGATASTSFNVTVNAVNDAPVVVTPIGDVVVPEDSPAQLISLAGVFDDVDLAIEGDSLTYSVQAVSNPALFSVAPSIAGNTLTVTPAPNATGSSTLTIRATDTAGAFVDTTFNVDVSATNDTPVVVTPATPLTVAEDAGAGSIDFAGVFDDVDIPQGDSLTLSVSNNSNPTLFAAPPAMAGNTLNFTLAPNQNGGATIEVTATDTQGATATTTVDITVTPVNDAPTVTAGIADRSANEDDPPIVVTLGTAFGDVDIATNGDTLTYTVTGNSNAALFQSVVVAGDTLTLTLAPNANGAATITVTATDTFGANVADPFVVTVNSVDDVPFAVDDNATMDEDGAPITIAVLANDTRGESPDAITDAGTPDGHSDSPPTTIVDPSGTPVTAPNGTVTLNADMTITYEPKPNFSGTDFFDYTLRDAEGQTSTARVTITVNALPDAPNAPASIEYTMVQGTALDVLAAGLLDYAFDFDGDGMTVGVQSFPSSGATLSVSTDGAFVFTPPAAFVGVDTFNVVFSDGGLTSAPVPVNVTVTPAPPAPPAPPAGEVEFDLDLANVPLEDSVSAEANVLIVMDDSGSMDWNVMVDMGDDDGRFVSSNSGWKLSGVTTRSKTFEYLLPLRTNTSGSEPIPAQETIDADSDFTNNNHGFWRARYSGFNPIYYNPKVRYQPWSGLNRNNVEFANINPAQAPLDPYDAVASVDMCSPITENDCTHIDLTQTYSYVSEDVPRRNSTGRKDVTTSNYYIPQYYTTTATGAPAHNAPHTRVLINAASAPFAGGPDRTDCANPNACTYAEEIQNFANWFSYYRSREYTAKAALGRAVNDVTNVRMGYAALNDTNERIRVASMNASFRVGAKAALLAQIYSPDSRNSTPLRTGLDKAGKYFACKTGDSFGSTSDTVPGNANCPVLPAPEGICQANFTLLFSDGLWNQSFSGDADHNHDGSETGFGSNTQFDGGRYADTISGTLADVAMYYYERDLHPALENGVPTMERDRLGAAQGAFTSSGELMHQHMKTYTIAFGLTGTPDLLANAVATPYTSAFSWPDPNDGGFAKVDDMVHAAVNGRGDFLSANNPTLLSNAFQSAFTEFSSGSISVSAVAFNSTALREQTVEYRGFFNLKFNTGDLKALDVDPSTGMVDEASPIWRAAQRLDAIAPSSRVIVTYDRVNNEGIPFRWADLNANQKAMMDADEIDFIRGVRTNEEPSGTFRQRPLVEGVLGDIVHSAPQFVGSPRAVRRDQEPFPTDDLYSNFRDTASSREPVVYVAANDGMLHGFNAGTGVEMFGYVPNKLIDTSQRFQNDLDQLASIVYAHRFFVDLTPTVEDVYMPESGGTLTKSWNTVLIGGLRGGGKGYYALNVTDPNSSFATENAAKNTVLWEFTDADDTYPVDSLGAPVGGAVGAVVDALGQPVKDLGYTFSQPQIVMSNVKDSGSPQRNKWIAVFGNGYNSTHGFAKLFALFIEDGLDGWAAGDFVKLDTGFGPLTAPDPDAGYPNGLSTPAIIDEDLNGTADVAYAGDLLGHLYRFDMRDPDPANWKATLLFTATYGTGASEVRQPITTQPFVFKHPTQTGFVIVFGTGSYFTEGDATSVDIQSIYGVWDRNEVAPVTANDDAKETRLVEQTITNVVDESQPLFARLRAVSANTVEYTPDGASGENGVYGWFIDLDPPRATTTLSGAANPDTSGQAPPDPQFPGERAVRRFVPRGDSLLVTTVIPRDANTCLRAPPGAVFPIDLLTGGNPKRPILDLNNDGRVDDNDLVTVGGIAASAGFLLDTDMLDGTVVDPSVLLGTGEADFLFLSGGSDQQTIRIAGPEDPKTGRLSWRELDDAN
jgi:type IV pilus assembly protein PilY1